jgi:DUF1009 family protein
MVEQARAQGIPVRLIAFKDETDQSLLASFPADQCREIEVGKLGDMLTALKELDAKGAVMAGQITPRKLFSGMVPDMKLIALLAVLPERNAETIFGGVSSEIEKIGVRMLDARVFLDDHLATEGKMTGWLGGSIDAAQQVEDHGIREAEPALKPRAAPGEQAPQRGLGRRQPDPTRPGPAAGKSGSYGPGA